MMTVTSSEAQAALETLDNAMCDINWERCTETPLAVGEAWDTLQRFIQQNSTPLDIDSLLDSDSLIKI